MDSVVVGTVSKAYSTPQPLATGTGIVSPLSLLRLTSTTTRTLELTVTTTAPGVAPDAQRATLDVVTATLNVEVGNQMCTPACAEFPALGNPFS